MPTKTKREMKEKGAIPLRMRARSHSCPSAPDHPLPSVTHPLSSGTHTLWVIHRGVAGTMTVTLTPKNSIMVWCV